MMKIAIIGAGNIGTAMAALICGSDAQVTVVARGARLQAIARDGLALNDRGTRHDARPKATEALSEVQDAVFLCVKSQQLGAALDTNRAGIGPETLVIPMVNGLPFWFFLPDARPVPHTDPQGILARLLRPEQVLGAVLLMTVSMDAAGVAQSTNTPTLSLAPVAPGADGAKVDALIQTLNAGGVVTDLSEDIRAKVLVKLMANVTTNPLSALVDCTLEEIGQRDDLCALAFAVADEFRAWAKADLGRDLPPNPWLRDLLLDAGPFSTSMLQDARAGRTLELDAIARAAMTLAEDQGQPMRCLAAIVHALDTAPSLPLSGDAAEAALSDLTPLTSLERTP